METTESQETGPQLIRLAKFVCVFIFVPAFLYGLNKAFLSNWNRPRMHWSYHMSGVILVILSLGYLATAMTMYRRYGFPPLRRHQILAWLQGFVALYIIQVLVFVTRFNWHRSHWATLLPIDGFLFLITLPIAAWFPKKYREPTNFGKGEAGNSSPF